VRLILDTHTLLWTFLEPEKLSVKAKAALADLSVPLFVSIASLWEITIKVANGKMALVGSTVADVLSALERSRIQILPIRTAHLLELQTLPRHHKDPFDRILIAQARAEQIPLVTVDKDIRRYDVQTIW